MKSFLLLLFLLSCSKCPEKVPPTSWQEISGREELALGNSVRRPIYRAKVPSSWKRIDPSNEESLTDTTKPNCAFLIEENDQSLKVTIHSFLSESFEKRVPPIAQIERWKRQKPDPNAFVYFLSQGGFAGYCLEGSEILAWIMQMDPEHYQTLSFLAKSPEEKEHYMQMRADYTIKATGSASLLENHKEELMLFAKSFELVQEIPTRS